MGLFHVVGTKDYPYSALPAWCNFSGKRVRYFMDMAKVVTDSENPCPARQIGVVIADPHTDTLVSTGHNGPTKGSMSCDNENYLKDVFWPQLTEEEKWTALNNSGNMEGCEGNADDYLNQFLCIKGCIGGGVGVECPRRMIGAPSGKRLELCVCIHGETSAIVNAHRSVAGCYMFCDCGIPCLDCCKIIVNSDIYCVVCIEREQDYSPYSSRWVLKHSRTNVLILGESWLEKN